MSHEVFVDKTSLFNVLGPSALKFAMFMASGTQEGTALRIMLDNVDRIDLNCDLMQQELIPLLQAVGVLDAEGSVIIQNYINQTLGLS
jgi:hypothetical protein